MRHFFFALMIAVSGCAPVALPVRTPESFAPLEGERIDLFYSDMSSDLLVNLSINQSGNGRFKIIKDGQDSAGTFAMKADNLIVLYQRLSPYKQEAAPTPSRDREGIACAGGYRSHQGAIVVRWVESGSDIELYISRQCVAERFRARNDELISIIQQIARPLVPGQSGTQF